MRPSAKWFSTFIILLTCAEALELGPGDAVFIEKGPYKGKTIEISHVVKQPQGNLFFGVIEGLPNLLVYEKELKPK